MDTRKRLSYLILITFLFFSAFLHSQDKEKYTISILNDIDNGKVSELIDALKREITSVVGQDKNITFLDVVINNLNQEKAKSNYLNAVSKSDIILAFGALNTKVIYELKDYPKPTIVFSGVSKDFVNLSEGQKTSGVENITFLIPPQSYSQDLDVFKSIYDYKTIGILVDKAVYQNLPIQALLDNYFDTKPETYKLINLANVADIENQLDELDAIYLAGGLDLTEKEFSNLVKAITNRKIPSFSSFGKFHLNKGILATNQPDNNIEQFFRRIALTVEYTVNGTSLSELPMFIDYDSQLTINTKVAKDIGFAIKYSLIGRANFVGGEEKVTQANALSILDVIDGVIERNLDLQTVQKDVELADQDLSFSKSSYYPNVNAGVNALYTDPELAEINPFNREFVTDGTLTAEQLIYSQEASTNVRVQREALEVQRQVYSASELDAVLNATIAYFNTLVLKTNAQIQNQNLQVTKKNLQISKENYEAGSAGKSDMLRFKSQLAQDTQGLVEAQNGLIQAYNALNQLLNNPISQDIDIQDAEIAKGIFERYNYKGFLDLIDNPNGQDYLVEFLVQEALSNAPELKGIEFNKNILKANYKLNTIGRFIPTLALQGQYNYNFYRSDPSSGGGNIPSVFLDDFYTVGLNLSLPLFQQSQRNINKQTIKIQEEQLGIEQENLNLFFEKNVNDLVLELLNQVANIETSKLAEEAAKESLELTQTSYQEGAVPVIQLIDAQTNYLQSQLARATANYAYFIASMQLERTIGYFFLLHSKEENAEFIQRAYQFILNQN